MAFRNYIKMIVTTDNTIKPAEELLKMLDPEIIKSFGGFVVEHDGTTDIIKIQDDYVKWDPAWDEVAKFDEWRGKLAEYFEDNFEAGGYSYIRLGEDGSRIEEEEAGEPLLRVMYNSYITFEDEEEVKTNEFNKKRSMN